MSGTRASLWRKCAGLMGGILVAGACLAAPLADNAFGQGGLLRVGELAAEEVMVSASLLQANGKLVVGGWVGGRSPQAFVLRLDSSGLPDAGFGNGGVTLLGSVEGVSQLSIVQIEQRADASLLLGVNANNKLGLIHLLASGEVDLLFGGNGIALQESAFASNFFGRFIQLADGGLLLVRDQYDNGTLSLLLTRLTWRGSLNNAWGNNGSILVSGFVGSVVLQGLVARADGGFFALGVPQGEGVGGQLLKVDATGAVDPRFGVGGVLSAASQGRPDERFEGLAAGLNGSLMLWGCDTAASGRPATIWQLSDRGVPALSFGVDGRAVLPGTAIRALRVSALGVYFVPLSGTGRLALRKLFPNGGVDPNFGSAGGIDLLPQPYVGWNFIGLHITTEGALMLAGWGERISCGVACAALPKREVLAAKIAGTGAPIAGYGRGDGFASWSSVAYSHDRLDAILPGAAGKLLFAGLTPNPDPALVLAWSDAQGVLDTSRGAGSGRVLQGVEARYLGSLRAVQTMGNTSIVASAAGEVHGGLPKVESLRLDAAGNQLPDYNPAPAAPLGSFPQLALAALPDGRVLYAAATLVAGNAQVVVERRLADGTPDPGFGDSGSFALALPPGSDFCAADLVLLPDGAIVLGVLGSRQLILYKIDATGRLVDAFGQHGQALVGVAGGFGAALQLHARSDARIVAGFNVLHDGMQTDFVLVTVSPGGATQSVRQIHSNTGYALGRMLALPDQSLIVVRNTDLGWASLYRLRTDGSIDPDFGPQGQFALEGVLQVTALALDAEQRLLVAGQDATSAIVRRYTLQQVPRVVPVAEFYHASLGHYFITADSGEMAGIDAGAAGPGWSRTGLSFQAYAADGGVAPGAQPVCRFYGTPGVGPNSHFYTINAAECAWVRNDPGWTYEGIAFFALPAIEGQCAAGTQPIYRAYNQRFAQNDSNHRYGADAAVYAQMQAQGWKGEGVVFCAVQ